jgi:hypothetical protein
MNIVSLLLLNNLDGPSNLWFPTAIERDRNSVCVQHMFVANVHVHRTGMQICMHACRNARRTSFKKIFISDM